MKGNKDFEDKDKNNKNFSFKRKIVIQQVQFQKCHKKVFHHLELDLAIVKPINQKKVKKDYLMIKMIRNLQFLRKRQKKNQFKKRKEDFLMMKEKKISALSRKQKFKKNKLLKRKIYLTMRMILLYQQVNLKSKMFKSRSKNSNQKKRTYLMIKMMIHLFHRKSKHQLFPRPLRKKIFQIRINLQLYLKNSNRSLKWLNLQKRKDYLTINNKALKSQFLQRQSSQKRKIFLMNNSL